MDLARGPVPGAQRPCRHSRGTRVCGNISGTRSSQLAPDAIIVVTHSVVGHVLWPFPHIHELPVVEKVDDVQLHPLTHQLRVDSC